MGCTELKPTFEAGLQLELHVWRSDDSRIKLDIRIPLRDAFTFQAPPHSIGTTLTPGLKLKAEDPWGYAGWKAGLYVGPLFANRRYDNYFYSVPPQNATASRPVYQAAGGYAGAQFVVDISKRFPHYWFGAFVRYDNLTGAVFEDSPLVRQENYWSAGFAFAWMIGRSSTIVQVAD